MNVQLYLLFGITGMFLAVISFVLFVITYLGVEDFDNPPQGIISLIGMLLFFSIIFALMGV